MWYTLSYLAAEGDENMTVYDFDEFDLDEVLKEFDELGEDTGPEDGELEPLDPDAVVGIEAEKENR